MTKYCLIIGAGALLGLVAPRAQAATPLIDKIVFGDAASEAQHAVDTKASELVVGGLGASARRLTPASPDGRFSGDLTFKLTVDPTIQNYASIRLWGGDVNDNKLTLFCDGKQVGYRHLGDVEILDIGTQAPPFAGRFTYRTFPLPTTLTKGRAQLDCAIRASGPFAVYTNQFEGFQKPMTQASRPIYGLYVHAAPFLATDEPTGQAPAAAGRRPSVGAEVLDDLKARVNAEVERQLARPGPVQVLEAQFLARAYGLSWTKAYRNPLVAQKIIQSGDAFFARYQADPKSVHVDSSRTNPDWEVLGPFGKALRLLAPEISKELDATIASSNGAPISRREAYGAMLNYGLDYALAHRRVYTNQSMIIDLQAIYYSNEGLRAIGSAKARPEPQMRQYLYEAMGLKPWTGSLDAVGKPTYSSSARDTGGFRSGDDYRLFTNQGLSKELGYVGSYGEILDWATGIYLATVRGPGDAGDPTLRAQLLKLAKARTYFRYPALDGEGAPTMLLEAPIGWRDPVYPGATTYVQKSGWDNTPFYTAVATRDPQLMAIARQMLDDNQYFAVLRERLKDKGQRTTIGLLEAYDEWEAVRAWPRSKTRLPMTAGQPDFVFADPEDGVVALKNGEDVLYASLYWRANCGVNNLARFHYQTPRTDRIATIAARIDFTSSGQTCVRQATPHISAGAIPIIAYPGEAPAALEGEILPVAKAPPEARYRPGADNPYAGRGYYYQAAYGPYLIAMNAGAKASLTVDLPPSSRTRIDLVTRRVVEPSTRSLTLKPGQTAVLYTPVQ
ncbi:hypothetical protein PMI01_00411 [Caulobacter sp. AP07]|uniref:hypothetical protein n=1 Tax=Caulobacter sp. AP07 TaxID=1144304 RepID=UPI0002721FB4|nr:hypothetical protein [Caulobacter sp. AP07]EJL37957.1 hypothetical protein PMI01_00411 [Caulobacter sp. AP07]